LFLIVYFSFRYTALVFDTYDPFSALAHLGNEFDERIFAYSVLGFVLITSLFSKGRWCRYLCPLGAFFALLNKINFFKLTRNQTTCTACGSCNRVCPANLKIKESAQITHPDCISCMECVTDCPHSSLEIHVI
jgi:polyferredoxin